MKTIINNIQISAIASWLPTDVLEMISFSEEYGEKETSNIIKATGVQRVRIAKGDDTSSDMCFRAAENLIEKENIDKSTIDGLVFVSQTTDFILPATSISLQHRLGLSKDTVCIDIHYGCSGYIYGIFQAALWISSKACKNVLILAGDTTSRMINPKDKSLRMVFGDCGTATLMTVGPNSIGVEINSDGSGMESLIIPAGGFRLPSNEDTEILEYDLDNNGRTANDLFMDGLAIFNFAITNVPKSVHSLLELMDWNKENIGFFALHQANDFMVNYVRKKIKAPVEITPMNVTNYGNTGPASIPLLFSDICSQQKFNLDKVIMSGFGVGLSWGSIACDMSETRFYEPVNK